MIGPVCGALVVVGQDKTKVGTAAFVIFDGMTIVGDVVEELPDSWRRYLKCLVAIVPVQIII